MFEVFGSGARKPAGSKKSSRKIVPGSAGEELATSEDASLRLEKELAVLLARKPKHRKRPQVEDSDDLDHEAPLLLDADDNTDDIPTQNGKAEAAPDAAETVADKTAENVSADTAKPGQKGESDTCARWMQSTRRSRRSNLFRKTASVAITFAVTTFIISVVAVILFGLPNGFKKLIASNDQTASVTGQVNPTANAEPAPVRMRWVSR